MFALVKNLMTSRIRKIDCSELYNINRAACTYQLFKPTSTEDFVQKKCYGSIVNDKLVFNYILALSESEEQIMEWLDQPRLHKIPNPKRISDSPAFLSLVKCKLAEEKESCRAQKDSNHPKEVKKKFEQEILKKFKNINANTNKSELLKVPDLKVENKTSPVIASKRMQEERTEPQNKKKFKSFEGVCVCSSIKEEVELLKSENLDLKGKLTFATDSIESLESERRRLLEECEKLKVELQSTLNSHGSHIHEGKVALQEEISQLKTVVSDFRAAQENLHKKEGCALSKLQSAEDSDDNDNVFVDNSKVLSSDSPTVGVASAKVFENLVSPYVVPVAVNILNCMKWSKHEVIHAYKAAFPKKEEVQPPKDNPISGTLVKYQLRRATYYAREVFFNLRKSAKTKTGEDQKKSKDKRNRAVGKIKKQKPKRESVSRDSSESSIEYVFVNAEKEGKVKNVHDTDHENGKNKNVLQPEREEISEQGESDSSLLPSPAKVPQEPVSYVLQ